MRAFALLLGAVLCAHAVDTTGSTVYKEHCATCHSQKALRIPSEDVLRQMSPRRIVNSLEAGTMMGPGRRLTPAERRSVAEFLTGKPFSVEPLSAPDAGRCTDSGPLVVRESDPSWNGWSNDLRNRRFQTSPGFAAEDLGKLRLKWAFGFEGDVVAFGQPALLGGRLFAGSAGGTVYSLDASTGCKHWQYEAEAAVRTAIVLGPYRAGKHAAYFGDLHANVYAVDAETGQLLWKSDLDAHPAARITGAPALHEGRLYVPVSSFEEGMASHSDYECCTFRGSVAAVDASTGKEIWRTYMIDRPARPTERMPHGTQAHGPSGVAVWSAPTIDTKRGRLYVTTGDNYSEPATGLSDAIVALRLRDGRIEWSQQVTPNDIWNAACLGDRKNCPEDEGPDADFGSSAILVTTKAGRDLLIAGQKSGMVYALDPDKRGQIVWQTRAGKGGLLGGIQWGHAVDSEKVYAPVSDMVLDQPATTGGGLVAIRPEDGKIAWRADPAKCGDRTPCSPAQMAAATVMPGAVFSGARDGVLRAYAADNGKVLWSFDTMRDFQTVNGVEARGGAIDGPGVVIAGGMLFMTSGYAFWGGAGGNVLLAFSLPESDLSRVQ